jgi:hypothetical protein
MRVPAPSRVETVATGVGTNLPDGDSGFDLPGHRVVIERGLAWRAIEGDGRGSRDLIRIRKSGPDLMGGPVLPPGSAGLG